MATIGQDCFPVEFNMADSPIVLVLDGVLSGFPVGSVFRQMEITVPVKRSDTGESKEFVFLVDVDGSTLTVDIASAVRSALFDVEYKPSMLSHATVTYPYVSFSVKYREKYMMDGDIYYGSSTEINKGSMAVGGRISDLDRLRVTAHVSDYFTKLRFTTKPLDGMEIVPEGERVIVNGITSDGFLQGKTQQASGTGSRKLSDGRTIYVMENDGTMFPLVFVNSLGVLDTATAICREALSYGIESESFNITGVPSNMKVYGREALKGGGRAVLTMSSGFVTRKWADWWAEEVMRTKKCWVKFGKQHNITGDVETVTDFWAPCILTPKDDTVQVYDRSEQQLCYVEFELEVCAEGSILRGIRD